MATAPGPSRSVLPSSAHRQTTAQWGRPRCSGWERFVDGAGFSRAFLRRIRELAEQAPAAVRAASDDLVARGWDDPLLAQVVEIVDARSRCVVDALSA